MATEGSCTELVARAMQIAALDTDIAGFPRGLDTPVGELGVRVSGGQRQRLGLARNSGLRPGPSRSTAAAG